MDVNFDWTELQRVIDRAEAGGGTVGVTAIPSHGAAFTHRGERRFRAASTVKIPIMIEIYRQIDRGERALADLYRLRSDDRAPGSGILLHLHEGAELTLEDLIYLMISISDNTATNVLIDMAGMENVGATMRSLGMAHSTLGRKMKGRPAQGDEQENWATPDEYAAVVGALLDGRAASASACERMLAMLEKQQCTRRISRYLPEDESIRWGSKTGSIAGVTNDVGFVASDRGTVIVSVFCEDLADQHVGEQVIGDVARAALRATSIVEPTSSS
jgi:beta-lactamase class A